MDKEKAYICVKKKLAIDTTKDIIVKNCAEVFCTSPELKEFIENIKVKDRNIEEDWDRISAIQITESILRKYPHIDLDVIGEPELLLEYKSQENKNKKFDFLLDLNNEKLDAQRTAQLTSLTAPQTPSFTLQLTS